MIYKYATLGILALTGAVMSVPASAQSSPGLQFNNLELAARDGNCILEKFSTDEMKTTALAAAASTMQGDENPDPKMILMIEQNAKECAGKVSWNDARQEDAAAFSTIMIIHSGLAGQLLQRGIDFKKLDAWFQSQDASFKAINLDTLNEKEGEKFGLRVVEGLVKSGISSDAISEHMEAIMGYVAMSMMVAKIAS